MGLAPIAYSDRPYVVERIRMIEKIACTTAVVAGRDLGSGVGRTKKEAEQKAAESAYVLLKQEIADRTGPEDG